VTAFAALLRAVNVGGTGKLPMTELKRLCEEAGFAKVKTFIASGNVVFTTNLSEAKVKEALERALESYAGKRIDVYVRTADELAQVVRDNSFFDRPANRTLALFLDDAPPQDAVDTAKGRADEEIALGKREIYVFYSSGIADSKLRFPAVKGGTSRNMNTVAKLAAMAAGL
jgi:uncharacterized protein (DUF1697 family)